MSSEVALAGPGERPSWTPARIFMTVSAVWHLPLGIAGLVIDQTFPVGAQATIHADSEHIFGVFETNGWHSLAGVVLGLVSLLFALRPQRARGAALAIGVFHVAVFGALLLWGPETFWLASNTSDQVDHAATAIAALVTGLMTPRAMPS